MTKSINRLIVLCSAVVTIMLSGCGSSNSGAVPSGVTINGAALYASECSSCHGILSASTKSGATVDKIQGAINSNAGSMGSLSSLTAAEIQAISVSLGGATAPTTTPATTPSSTPVPSPTPTPAPTPIDGATLYATDCAGCHGQLAASGKRGTTIARVQAAISGKVGGMGPLSTLSAADIQAIVTALSATTTPAPTPTPTSTPTPTPIDGATLYANSCAGCHGPLATSDKRSTTLVRLQAGISGNAGGMGLLSTLTSAQLQAIVTVLATVTPAPTTTTPPACGSCHTIPPAAGRHSTHSGRSCATCHGTGYSTTTVNASTHNNGVKNVASTIGWNATTRTCSNSCHGTEKW